MTWVNNINTNNRQPEREMPLPTDNKTLLSLLRFQYYEMHEVPGAALYYSPTATNKHKTQTFSLVQVVITLQYQKLNICTIM